jgi:transcriptional regulator with GAF, ATPase, and Fis domain
VKKKQSSDRVRVLLTFTGFHDPFSASPISGTEKEGPILNLIRSFPFDEVVLFATPNTLEQTAETERILHQRHPTIACQVCQLKLADPTNYLEILANLRREFETISKRKRDAGWYVATASGTPQMHACWVMLVASGEIPGRLLHVRPPQFVTDKTPMVTEVDLTQKDFPTIRSRLWAEIPLPDGSAHDPKKVIEALGIVGDHPTITQALETSSLLAQSDVPVLILGESGSGKEKIATLIHRLSRRAEKPFVALNCAAIPEQLAESTLFGHCKGAFTGATASLKGKFESANSGTLFLDEIGELPKAIQGKLLRTVQEGVIEPLGEETGRKVNVRLIAATHRDLQDAVAKKEFREDLFYRLRVGEVRIPPLRERRSDIIKLAVHFLDEINATLRKPRRFTPEALIRLQQHSWPGNIRELCNAVQRAAVLCKTTDITPENLDLADFSHVAEFSGVPNPHEGFKAEEWLKGARKILFERALRLAKGKQSDAARLLGLSPQAVFKFLKA